MEIVDKNGGDRRYDGREDDTLAVAYFQPLGANPAARRDSFLTLYGKRILLVEDEPIVAMCLEDMVAALGAENISWASDLEQAQRLAESQSFDLAVMDINLKGIMSYPAAEILAARSTPVILATGYAREQIPLQLRHLPLLQKPYTETQLRRAIAATLPGGAATPQ